MLSPLFAVIFKKLYSYPNPDNQIDKGHNSASTLARKRLSSEFVKIEKIPLV